MRRGSAKSITVLKKILLDASVTVLRDKTVNLTENNQTIQLAGLDDPDFSDRASYNQQEILENTLCRYEPYR